MGAVGGEGRRPAGDRPRCCCCCCCCCWPCLLACLRALSFLRSLRRWPSSLLCPCFLPSFLGALSFLLCPVLPSLLHCRSLLPWPALAWARWEVRGCRSVRRSPPLLLLLLVVVLLLLRRPAVLACLRRAWSFLPSLLP
jgi:hypothetical protein